MLQQTQVNTVIPYWGRWMQKLPTVPILARTPRARVLKLWEGLGYYRRAHHAHMAARVIMSQYQGQFPRAYEALLDLPGIGRYTAGAICSIAYNQPVPVLDGNITRVLARLFALAGDPHATGVNHTLWALSERLIRTAAEQQSLSPRPCADLNQALMELGALICTPKTPRCSLCPIQRSCLACLTDRTRQFPQTRPRPTPTRRRFAVFVIRHGARVLARRQPETAWNAGLWEFPSVEMLGGQTHPDLLLSRCLKAQVVKLRRVGRLTHSITRYRLLLDVHHVEIKAPPRRSGRWERWCRADDLRALALSGAHRKILDSWGL